MCQHSNINGEICLLWDNFSYKGRVQKKKKEHTSLVHAQTHDMAKLWLHKNTQNSEHKEGATQDLHI